MARTKSRLEAVLDESTEALRKTYFDLLLHYSSADDGWRAVLGSGGEADERWKNADPPASLVDALRAAIAPLHAQHKRNASLEEARVRRTLTRRRTSGEQQQRSTAARPRRDRRR